MKPGATLSPVLMVTGSRCGHPHVTDALDRWVARYGRPPEMHVGDAPGVDMTAENWAREHRIGVVVHRANWTAFGKRAGPLRNAAMVAAAGSGAHCVGFPVGESRGTSGCMSLAAEAGLRVFVVSMNGTPHAWPWPP